MSMEAAQVTPQISTLSYLLSTEVKGKSIPKSEQWGNWFLSPHRYFWSGKKVDLIQRGKEKIVQWDDAFTETASTVKKIFYVLTYAPSVIMGIALKTFAHLKCNDPDTSTFIKKRLNKNKRKLKCPKGQQGTLAQDVQTLIQNLRELNPSWNDFLDYNKTKSSFFFLSEIRRMRLHYEGVAFDQFSGNFLRAGSNRFNAEGRTFFNRNDPAPLHDAILKQLELLPNLRRIGLSDKQPKELDSKVFNHIKEQKIAVQYLKVPENLKLLPEGTPLRSLKFTGWKLLTDADRNA